MSCRLLGVVLALLMHGALAADDGVVDHARRAMQADDPQTVVYLLEAMVAAAVSFDEARMLLAEARAALGHQQKAQDLLQLDDGFPGPWPAAWQGRAALLRAHLALDAQQPNMARTMLINALEAPGHTVDRVACLVLLADLVDDEDLRRRCLQRAWRSWDGGLWRARAGLMLADDALHAGDAVAARDILTELHAAVQLPSDIRQRARLMLVRILVDSRPVAALDFIRSELARSDEGSAAHKTLLVYRVAAQARIDPHAAQWLRQALPASLHDDPVIVAVDAELAGSRTATDEAQGDALAPAVLKERARALLEHGQQDTAVALLSSLAAEDVEALYLSVVHGGDDPAAWSDRPLARTPLGALVLATAWQGRGDQQQAMKTLRAVPDDQSWPDAAQLDGQPYIARLVLRAAQLTRVQDEDLHHRLASSLRGMTRSGWESGTAWAWYAEDQGSAHGRAWIEAASRLPTDHPWSIEVTIRAVRPLLAPVPPGHVLADPSPQRQEQLQEAVTLLSRMVRAGDGPDHHRARFLLVQALAQLGRRDEALQCMEPLWASGDARHRTLLEDCRRRLMDHGQGP